MAENKAWYDDALSYNLHVRQPKLICSGVASPARTDRSKEIKLARDILSGDIKTNNTVNRYVVSSQNRDAFTN